LGPAAPLEQKNLKLFVFLKNIRFEALDFSESSAFSHIQHITDNLFSCSEGGGEGFWGQPQLVMLLVVLEHLEFPFLHTRDIMKMAMMSRIVRAKLGPYISTNIAFLYVF